MAFGQMENKFQMIDFMHYFIVINIFLLASTAYLALFSTVGVVVHRSLDIKIHVRLRNKNENKIVLVFFHNLLLFILRATTLMPRFMVIGSKNLNVAYES